MAHEYTSNQLAQALRIYGVPSHLHSGLLNYVAAGVPTGGGLRRVLENQPVSEVVAGLDDTTAAYLQELLRWLHSYAPSACHGSPAAVQAWINRRGLQGPQEGSTP